MPPTPTAAGAKKGDPSNGHTQRTPPPKKTARQKRTQRNEYAERNAIEGRIGNSKQAYSLNQIKAKLRTTSEAWIGLPLLVMNLSAFAANLDVTF